MNPFAVNDALRVQLLLVGRLSEAINEQRWNTAVALNRAEVGLRAEAAGSHGGQASGASLAPLGRPSADLGAVMACIRAHESGDYTEHSHISDGSGAYQMIPGTWQSWSARAGYPGYTYAYEAPAAVQDAVTAYTLQNGGAGNWSNRYGFDPCTQGMGG